LLWGQYTERSAFALFILFSATVNPMEFFKPGFLAFFVIVFVVYWRLQRHGLRMGWMLLASAVYYASFSPWFLVLLFGSTLIDYFVAMRLPKTESLGKKRALLTLSIGVNLGILASFKYAIFMMETTQSVSSLLGYSLHVPTWKVVLPLGISFYTFEAISYVVDVYRGKIAPLTSLRDYMLYILFFPHLLAGPIVRSHDFVPQLHRTKRFSWLRLEVGVRLFLFGLFKKAVIADWMAGLIDPVFATPESYSSRALWLATIGYTVQIYCDFSGYSDMAVGLAHMFGFKLPANFATPYLATSISDFWRRWHISLSSWLRDYLYIPLGGNRGSEWMTYRNLLLTMTLGGLWHGASWTFVLWGVYHGLLLVIQRLCPLPERLRSAWWQPVWMLLTLLAVSMGWVLFRAKTFAAALAVFGGLFVPIQGTDLPIEQALIILTALTAILVGGYVATKVDLRKLQERLPVPVAGAAWAIFAIVYFFLLPPFNAGFIYFHF
jgi:alginate O-acetyltransferase complex protein AlgI